MCDLDHTHDHDHADLLAGNAPDLSRRQVMALLGAAGAGGATVPGLAADPAHAAATTPHAAVPEGYQPRTGLAKDSAAKDTALDWIDGHERQITALNDEIWEHAELSLREWHSSIAEAEFLRRNGFHVEWGAAGFPTAFVATASHGNGKPVIGFSGEYDALPGLSQKRGVGVHDPLEYVNDPFAPSYGPGHGCGHCALGSAAAGAAVAVSTALRQGGLDGTVKFYGSTAEEQLIGKAYAVAQGVYDGLDAMIDWHPGMGNSTSWGTNSALTAVTFTFLGVSGHGGTPLGNKSALDGVIMLATMTEFLREENIAPSGRLHYVINNGGDAPNVTPEIAEISYYVREGSPARVKALFDKVVACAQAAATASQTTMRYRITAACWNRLPSRSAAELLHENMVQIGPPVFTDDDQKLAKQIQRSLGLPEVGQATTISDLRAPERMFLGGGSTDVADISWQVPTVSLGTAVSPIGCKSHNWAVAASASAPMGHSALLMASRYLAATALDLLTQPERLAELKEEFAERTKGVQWQTSLPKNFEPPMYEPPTWFLRQTRQSWPPANITWPPRRMVSQEKFSSLGPELAPQT
ncbi:amidohydrolase [Actinopolymorpha pittospori]|uniref:Aminobenzoyl-glutamate utilization protein B n=1 Tax=Actinopolymorpha pittospori TaxID=648752 RepID=A0A927RC52_9ACTN|nr:amidohydrolase [Actinopolymorpha pittospori]MBE1606765.1 aminobenzoyl-glutamate utilization protein B [Actinopolymorpha pittospori]